MVEVFKTNVVEAEMAEKLIELIHEFFPHLEINFDLDDQDRILRIQSLKEIDLSKVKLLCNSMGCIIEDLE